LNVGYEVGEAVGVHVIWYKLHIMPR